MSERPLGSAAPNFGPAGDQADHPCGQR